MLSKKDRIEFEAYLRQCTDQQVNGVLEKERQAGRTNYIQLAKREKVKRDTAASAHLNETA